MAHVSIEITVECSRDGNSLETEVRAGFHDGDERALLLPYPLEAPERYMAEVHIRGHLLERHECNSNN